MPAKTCLASLLRSKSIDWCPTKPWRKRTPDSSDSGWSTGWESLYYCLVWFLPALFTWAARIGRQGNLRISKPLIASHVMTPFPSKIPRLLLGARRCILERSESSYRGGCITGRGWRIPSVQPLWSRWALPLLGRFASWSPIACDSWLSAWRERTPGPGMAPDLRIVTWRADDSSVMFGFSRIG